MKFRKKPITIEAWRNIEGDDVPFWVDDVAKRGTGGSFLIDTLEGRMRAAPGDWIICGVTGELYPCKDHIFQESYERVE